jgi:RHS repeat-associated protein
MGMAIYVCSSSSIAVHGCHSHHHLNNRERQLVTTARRVFEETVDGDNLIQETNGTGAVVARYEQTQNIDEPLAMLRGGAASFYHADGLGSVTSLSSAAGSIANTYTYDSFGNLTNSTGSLVNPFRYTARESDTETGLYYYRARYYDQAVGRFLGEDPAGFKAGINLYAYVRNTPTQLIDPFGSLPTSSLDGNIQILQNIFAGSHRGAGPSLIIPATCGNVLRTLQAQGYLTMQDWGTETANPFNFWDPFAHYGGWESRTRGPGLHFRIRYPGFMGMFGECSNSCTLDQFHIDAHNPLDHPWDHLVHDVFHL